MKISICIKCGKKTDNPQYPEKECPAGGEHQWQVIDDGRPDNQHER